MSAKPTAQQKENTFTKRREPHQFMLTLGMGSSVLVFATLSLLHLLPNAEADWQKITIPGVFWISTFLMLVSSITLYEANQAFYTERFKTYQLFLGLTLALAVGFVVLQVWGWYLLLDDNSYPFHSLTTDFIFLISGLHILHVLGGMIFLSIGFAEALKNASYIDAFVYSVNPPNQLKLKLITRYWHFVDLLWLCLFLFLLVKESIAL